MDLIFTRTGSRRYAVTARRVEHSDVVRSEELAALLHVRWCHGRGEGAVVDHGALPREPQAGDLRALEAALDDLDGFARRWGALAVGAAAHEVWPWPERPASHRRRA